jgi:hypothetical protein
MMGAFMNLAGPDCFSDLRIGSTEGHNEAKRDHGRQTQQQAKNDLQVSDKNNHNKQLQLLVSRVGAQQ